MLGVHNQGETYFLLFFADDSTVWQIRSQPKVVGGFNKGYKDDYYRWVHAVQTGDLVSLFYDMGRSTGSSDPNRFFHYVLEQDDKKDYSEIRLLTQHDLDTSIIAPFYFPAEDGRTARHEFIAQDYNMYTRIGAIEGKTTKSHLKGQGPALSLYGGVQFQLHLQDRVEVHKNAWVYS